MKLKKIEIALLCGVLAAVIGGAWLSGTQNRLSEKLIRLHVVANSDSDEDQAVKLRVRDAVLAAASPILAGAADADEAGQALGSQLGTLRQAAEAQLSSEGRSDAVAVTLGEEEFPERSYDTFSLPAGEYQTLRVTIGAGKGHNWWCVVFPSICLAACTEDLQTKARSAGLTDGEIGLITGENEGYVLKFRSVELVQEFLARFR